MIGSLLEMLQVNATIGIMVATSVLFSGLPERSKHENQSRTRRESGRSRMEIKKVPEGIWGGPHIIMEVTDESAVITCDCAVGKIDEPIKVDKNGRFNVKGSFTRQRGGPVRSDETPDRHPAHYAGRVNGKSMTLVIKLTNTNETLDTFMLTYGEHPELTRCM